MCAPRVWVLGGAEGYDRKRNVYKGRSRIALIFY